MSKEINALKPDIIIRDATIVDPTGAAPAKGDIAIAKGRISAVSPNLEQHAPTEIAAQGLFVSAGWIDAHQHMFARGTWNGIAPNMGCIPYGVTMAADAGSTGVSNYRELIYQLQSQAGRFKIMLNVSACGIIMPTQFPEPVDPALWNIDLFEQAFQLYGQHIMGLKLRINKGVVGALGLAPLEKALELAEHLHTRIIIHVTDAPEPMGTVVSMLRPGDVFCHVFHGTGHTIFETEADFSAIQEGKKRGVFFDTANGRGNFSLAVAKQAIQRGFLPNSISTDVTLQNLSIPVAGPLPSVMSRYLALGMDLHQIISAVTQGPAKELGVPGGYGRVEAGAPGDLTVFSLKECPKLYTDRFKDTLPIVRHFIPEATIINGVIQYRSSDLLLD